MEIYYCWTTLVVLEVIINKRSVSNSALAKAGGAIGHMYDRAVIHMTDRDVRA
jgi:hypothetical protein